MRDAFDIIAEMTRRDVHVRQYTHRTVDKFEIWADGKLQRFRRTPMDAETELRKLLGITNEEALLVEKYANRGLA